MSDDQGDAQTQTGATVPQPTAATPATAELRDLRAMVEELARRMGAGFREDLAQIRAIAASVAERDLTDDVRALRTEVAALGERDAAQPVLDELAALRSRLDQLAAGDDVRGLRAELAPVQATLDRLAARLDDDSGRSQVLARFQALEAKLDGLGGDDRLGTVVARLDDLAGSLEQRLAGVATAEQVGRLPADLRAHLVDALGGLDGQVVVGELAAIRGQLGGASGSLLEQLQDNLADVASGEVVGALWDEVRAVRDALEGGRGGDADVLESIATLRGEVEGIGAALASTAEPSADPAVVALRDDVQALADEVRALSDAVAGLERSTLESAVAPAAGTGDADVAAAQLTDELATLRAELAEGLVVEPSDALSASLDALRAELDELRSALAELPHADEAAAAPDLTGALEPLRADVASLRERFEQPTGGDIDLAGALEPVRADLAALRERLDEQPAGGDVDLSGALAPLRADLEAVRARLADLPAATPAPTADVLAVVHDELATLRAGIDEVRDRLDEGLVLEQDAPLAPPAPGPDLEVLADQIASLRDLVTSEVDGLRQAVVAERDRAVEAPTPPPAPPVAAGIDEAVIADLKDEIRAAGAIGDQVVDALREELKALRRRIAVKAQERVLDDEQLAQIADAVAARLAKG